MAITQPTEYWGLTENSTGAAAVSRAGAIAGLNLTDNNTVGSVSDATYGTVADFVRANTEWLSRADNATLSLSGVDFTWAFAVRFTTTANSMRILGKRSSSGSAATLEYQIATAISGNSWRFTVGDGSGTNVEAGVPGPLVAGTWYFVVARFDATTRQLSLSVNNGTPGTATLAGNVLDGTAGFALGRSGDHATSYLDGDLARVYLWRGTRLSDAEVTELYNGGQVLSYPFASAGISGTAAITLDDATLSSQAAVAVQGAASINLDAVILSSQAAIEVRGAAVITLDDVGLSATATVPITGQASISLDDVTLASAATVAVQASAAVTLDDVTLAAAATVPIAGQASITLDDTTLTSSATVEVRGALAVTLDNVALSAEAVVGTVPITGSLAVTLDDVMLASTAAVTVQASASIALDDVSLSAQAGVAISAALAVTLDDVAVSAQAAVGTVPITGQASIALDDVVLSAQAAVAISAVAVVTLDDVSLVAAATVAGPAPVVVIRLALTLPVRPVALTLPARDTVLTLPTRPVTLTLETL